MGEYLQFTTFCLDPAEISTMTRLGSLAPFRRYFNAEMEDLKF